MMRCTACEKGNDAEHVHPYLHVYVCGACYLELEKPFIMSDDGKNQSRCIWCGEGDGSFLMMCDTCPYAFCYTCVLRNFGKGQARHAKEAKEWSCYACEVQRGAPGAWLTKIRANDGAQMINIEGAYALVRPPPATGERMIPEELRSRLSRAERRFVDLFASSGLYEQVGVAEFLTARDVQILKVLSKPLRQALHSLVITPGLFKTPHGADNACRLHQHQWASLEYMHRIEESSDEFGALRGGILADAPGLGKTVTCLALITSTSGLLPKRPKVFWDDDKLAAAWQENRYGGQAERLFPIFFRVCKAFGYKERLSWVHNPTLNAIVEKINSKPAKNYASIQEFEQAVHAAIEELSSTPHIAKMVRDSFRLDMVEARETLDKRSRAFNASNEGLRLKHERQLRPSSATLIVVPLVLLEHWYEQLARHLGLRYHATNRAVGRTTGAARAASAAAAVASSSS